MKRVFNISIIIFAIIGALASIWTTRNLIEENKLEKAYLINCDQLKIGMTIEEAKSIMRKGLDIHYRGFDYEIFTENDSIVNVSMNYPVEGGSYIISIDIDKTTGLVKSYNCPNKK